MRLSEVKWGGPGSRIVYTKYGEARARPLSGTERASFTCDGVTYDVVHYRARDEYQIHEFPGGVLAEGDDHVNVWWLTDTLAFATFLADKEQIDG